MAVGFMGLQGCLRGAHLAALNTSKLALATGVSPTPLRHSALLVNAMATLDDISGGRAILGVGSGGQATAGRLGVRKARIAEFRDELKLLRFLLDGGEVAVGSQVYRVESVLRRLPIYVAAWGPRMLEVSGELADGVIIMGPERKEVFAQKIEKTRDAARAAGRDPAEVENSSTDNLCVRRGPPTSHREIQVLAIHHMQRVGYENEYPPEYHHLFKEVRAQIRDIAMPEGKSPGTELVPDEFVKYSLMVGTESECRERLQSLLTLEPDEVVISLGYAQVRMWRSSLAWSPK